MKHLLHYLGFTPKHSRLDSVSIPCRCRVLGLVLVLLTTLGVGNVIAAVTYQATAISNTNALENGGKYIILQDGHVLINQVTSDKAQTTTTYNTTGLSGNETYVWILEASNSKWKLKSAAATTYYMSYKTGNNKGKMSYSTTGNTWTITYGSNKWKFVDSESRFLGFVSGEYSYKTYANSNYNSGTYPNNISLLKLSEETGSQNPTVFRRPFKKNFQSGLLYNIYKN